MWSLSRAANENLAREWHLVDNVLDQLNICEDLTLAAGPLRHWAVDDKFKELVEKSFPSMWKHGRVVTCWTIID